MRNVFKKGLSYHEFTFNPHSGILDIVTDDSIDRDFLILELQELASNMGFMNYEILHFEDDKKLEIVICG